MFMGKGVGEMINQHVLGSVLEVEIKNRQAKSPAPRAFVLSDSVKKCHIASVLDGTKDDIEWIGSDRTLSQASIQKPGTPNVAMT